MVRRLISLLAPPVLVFQVWVFHSYFQTRISQSTASSEVIRKVTQMRLSANFLPPSGRRASIMPKQILYFIKYKPQFLNNNYGSKSYNLIREAYPAACLANQPLPESCQAGPLFSVAFVRLSLNFPVLDIFPETVFQGRYNSFSICSFSMICRAVEICNLRKFTSPTRDHMPWEGKYPYDNLHIVCLNAVKLKRINVNLRRKLRRAFIKCTNQQWWFTAAFPRDPSWISTTKGLKVGLSCCTRSYNTNYRVCVAA